MTDKYTNNPNYKQQTTNTCAGPGHDAYKSAENCDPRSGGTKTDHEPGPSGYSDVDAPTYVTRDVSSGVVNTCDTGHYPFDMVVEISNADLKTSSKKMTDSTVIKGHISGNTDVMARVECLKSNLYAFVTKERSVKATGAEED